jgi:putative sigma-54 modulation protein
MQTANVNPPVKVTCRHIELTDALRDYAGKKIEGLHLDYPRIIEARVVLDVEKSRRQTAEIILFCANHITIQAKTTHEDLYAAIDETISKIARRMRKYKTRLLKSHRPRKQTIRAVEEQVYAAEIPESAEEEIEPLIIHEENYSIRPMYPDEAIMEMELSDRSFIVFQNAKRDRLSIIYRRKDGDYGIIEPSSE